MNDKKIEKKILKEILTVLVTSITFQVISKETAEDLLNKIDKL